MREEKSAKGSLLCVDLIRLNPLGNKIKSYVKVLYSGGCNGNWPESVANHPTNMKAVFEIAREMT